MGPGLDLVLSLVAIMISVFAFVARSNITFRDLLASTQDEAGRSRAELEEVRSLIDDAEQRLRGEAEKRAAAEAVLAQARSFPERLARDLQEAHDAVARLTRELHETRATAEAGERMALDAVARLEAAAATREKEIQIRRQLIDLNGSLRNTVFVLDRSKSMLTGNRWADALRIAETWIRYLPVESAALVIFGTDVVAEPPGPSLLKLDEQSRELLVAKLRSLNPEGETDTLAALKSAYSYESIDTIVLFTDGAPSGGPRPIYDYVAGMASRGVRINTVGLGDYFKSGLGDFLVRLAGMTGGSFIGR